VLLPYDTRPDRIGWTVIEVESDRIRPWAASCLRSFPSKTLSGSSMRSTPSNSAALIPRRRPRTVTAIRNGIVHFKEVRRDWRAPRDRCRLDRFAGWAKREVEGPLPERRVRPFPKM
jgi:hypothetical protein